MSITISGFSFMLLFALGPAITAAIDISQDTNNRKFHFDKDLINKNYETQIIDNKTLIKTLEEHNATNIINNDNYVECHCGELHLTFLKQQDDKPYSLQISYNDLDQHNPDELLVNDLSGEYQTNVQEATYNKIIERLEEQNMTIEDEEIYDDNTIVLTVNLE